VTLVYVSRFEIDADFIEEYDAWFAGRHVPDLLGVGFLSVSGYRSISRSEVCNLYEIPSFDVFGPAYDELARQDPFRTTLSSRIRGSERGVYAKVWGAGDVLAAPFLVIGTECDGAHDVPHWVGRRVPASVETVGAPGALTLLAASDPPASQSAFRRIQSTRQSPKA
jgi:hypothetical protein